ncbi:MAG: thioredoxin-dependent thiol peroxidase [Bacteroidia bacterium]
MGKKAVKAKPAKAAKKRVATSKKPKEVFQAHTTGLQEGMKAPDFSGLNQDGKQFSLADYKGKKLILYFYPQDNTETCTVEACNLQENLNSLKKEGYEVVGVSPDDVKSHRKFADKFGLNFNLLADPEHKAIKAYDVWGTKQFMGRIYDGLIRTTFIIDEKGVIRQIIRKVKSKEHAEQIRSLD